MRLDVFCTLFEELRTSPCIEIQTIKDDLIDFPSDLNETVRDEVRSKTGIVLSDELMACMNVSNAAGAYWTYQIDDQRKGAGEFKLQHLREVFLYKPNRLWSEETLPEKVSFLEKLRFIDFRPGAGDDKFAAFELDECSMPPPIWYYDRGDCYPMDIDYEEYLEALTLTKGITDWQYLFCRVDLKEPSLKWLGPRLQKNLDALSRLFPLRDYSHYYARLDSAGYEPSL